MRKLLILFAIWFIGFFFLFLQFNSQYSQLNLVPAVPKLILFCLVAVPVLVILLKNYDEKLALFFLMLFSISLRLIVPISSGSSAFYLIRDPIYNFGLTQSIISNAGWISSSAGIGGVFLDIHFTPGLNILSAIISQITGLNLFSFCLYFPPIILTVATILILFVTFKLLVGSKNALLAALFFAICYKFNTFNGLYLQESLGICFFALALFALVSMKSRKNSSSRSYSLVFILSSISIAWTHFFSGFIFLILMTTALFLSKVRWRSERFFANATDVMTCVTPFLAWISLYATYFISTGISYARYFLNQLPMLIQSPSEIVTVHYTPTGIILSPMESVVVYTGLFIPVFFAAICFLNLFIPKRKNPNFANNWLELFGVVSLVLATGALLGLRGSATPDIPYRLLTFFYLFISPLCAVGISTVIDRLDCNFATLKNTKTFTRTLVLRPLKHIVLVVLIIIPIVSTGLLMPSFLGNQVRLSDRDAVAASNWLSNNGNSIKLVVGETILAEPIAAYSNITFLSEGGSTVSFNQTMTYAFYYGNNMTYFTNYLYNNKDILLVVNKHFIDYRQYLLRFDTQTRVPSNISLNAAFATVDNLTFLDKVYDGNSPSMYVNTNLK